MKKLFTAFALAAMAATGASAAGFLTITVDGTVVKDGDVIVSNKLEIDGEEYDGEFEMWSWEIAPDFTIGSSQDASYSLTVTNKTESASVVSYCGVTGASTNTMMCQTLQPGDGWNDEGELEAGRSYKVSYDYQHIDLNNLPDKVEIYGQFNVEAEAGTDTESLSFDVNLIWPGEGAVDGIADEEFTLIVGNGRIEAANGANVEVYSLTGARVANEGLSGIYVARIGSKAVKVAVK